MCYDEDMYEGTQESSKAGWLIGFLVAASMAGAVYLGWSASQFFQTQFPDIGALKRMYPVVQYRGPEMPAHVVLQKLKPENWVELTEVSKSAVGAIIVSEDWAFYQHKGYDPNQIKEALFEDLERHRFAFGASTITQQVVKNVFLEKEKSLWRKLKEIYLAAKLEEKVGKHKVLETYLNVAEWGEGVYGIKAAARLYFGKAPAQLSAKEGAFLAMLLPSPKKYSQSFRTHRLSDYARGTIDEILTKMTRARYLTDEERDMERARPLPFEFPAGTAL